MYESNRNSPERRCFGRRSTGFMGWLRIKGRPKIPCVVRNFSQGGAQIELDVPSWLPYQFELQVEGFAEAFICEIRYVKKRAMGVLFVDETSEAENMPSKSPVDQVEQWMGQQARQPQSRVLNSSNKTRR